MFHRRHMHSLKFCWSKHLWCFTYDVTWLLISKQNCYDLNAAHFDTIATENVCFKRNRYKMLHGKYDLNPRDWYHHEPIGLLQHFCMDLNEAWQGCTLQILIDNQLYISISGSQVFSICVWCWNGVLALTQWVYWCMKEEIKSAWMMYL